ncbi:uncharacterized protein At4g15970-like [Andrographis paniculata]|uniref:uncharacterized protein At4g15970-like n=1 Tax=Andrographis paniculata TaxID=175694 RepID=UPI0021E8225E|nr:uncharacterized protein At4g15970-like [Andrographis paniculata]
MDHSSSLRIEGAVEEDGSWFKTGGGKPSNHGRSYSGVVGKIALLLAAVAVTCLVLNQSSYSAHLFQSSSANLFTLGNRGGLSSPACDASVSSPPLHLQGVAEDKVLKNVLREAAMTDGKTVIITTLNAAWTEPDSIFDLFLQSFTIGNQTQDLLKHVVVGALDQTAYSRCLDAHLHCYALTTAGVNFSGEAYFMSEDYLKMMWRRIDFLRTVLQLGFDFVFTDADVLWLRNPFERFFPEGDFQIACDHYWYNSTDPENSPNGGFNYVKSSNRTIEFYRYWHAGKDYYPGKHDQDVLNYIKLNPYVEELGLKMRFLDTAYFGGFCEPSKDLDLVVTMHANCCIGLDNKIHDIQMAIDDWKRYTSAGPSGVARNSTLRSWTMPRLCG